MNSFKTLIILSILCIAFSGCDDKELSLEDLNIAPELQYFSRSTSQWETVGSNNRIIDSAKVWTITNNMNYAAVFRSEDQNSNYGDLTITALDNDLDFFIDNALYENVATVALDSFSLAVRYTQPQIKRFEVKVRDSWDKEHTGQFEIHYLENRGPVANFELIEVNILTDNEYEINATTSFDRDNNLGGYIVEYEYTIDGVISTIPTDKINHVFSVGTHQIKLRCLDNDGAWSTQITKEITIN